MSTMPRAGLASAAGVDMTTGAASGDVMPRGDNQRLASSDGAGDGEMPRGQMGDASGATVAMPGAEARGLSAMPRSGMKVTGTWTVTVSGIALGA